MSKYVQLRDSVTGEPIFPIAVRDPDEIVTIESGGTGAVNTEEARTNLGLGDVAIEDVTPVSKGGTGATNAANARTNLGLGSVAVESTVPVSKGGTGKTTHTANSVLTGNGTNAVNNVATANGAFFATAANGAPKFGTLPLAQGGTGVTSIEALKTALNITGFATLRENNNDNCYYAKIGKIMICYGYTQITPTAVNTSTSKTVTLPSGYTHSPHAQVSLSGAPAIATCTVSIPSKTETTLTLALFANNTTTRGLRWSTVGSIA